MNKDVKPTGRKKSPNSVAKDVNNNTSLKKAGKKAKKMSVQNKVFAFCIVVLVLFIAFWVVLDKLFVVARFEIKGSESYSEQEAELVAESLGIEKGINLFSFNRKEYAEKAKFYIPEFDSVSIGYSFPDGIVFHVKEAKPSVYTELNGRFYVLSDALKVMSVHDSADEVEELALIRVYLSGVTKCQTGTFIETDNGCEEVLSELKKVLEEEEIVADVNEIDVRSKFSVMFTYKQRFTVKLGSADNFTVKVRFMKSIAEKLAPTDMGYIDVSDEDFREGIFKAYD